MRHRTTNPSPVNSRRWNSAGKHGGLAMNDVRPRHPEATTMAAFVEGALAPDEIAAVAEHLKGCSECRTVVSETARFEREEEAREAPAHANRWWLLAAAAVLAAGGIPLPLLRWNRTRKALPIPRPIQARPRPP